MFGGFSYFRTEGGGNFYGWNGSVAGNLNNWFGLVADFGGHYNSDSFSTTINLPGLPLPGTPPILIRSNTNTNVHTFMVGPRFSYRKNEKITPFAHLLVGGIRTHFETSIDFPDTGFPGASRNSFSDNRTTVAAAMGGGLDVNLSKSLALRVVQADFVLTRFFSRPVGNARVSVGLVYRFGGK